MVEYCPKCHIFSPSLAYVSNSNISLLSVYPNKSAYTYKCVYLKVIDHPPGPNGGPFFFLSLFLQHQYLRTNSHLNITSLPRFCSKFVEFFLCSLHKHHHSIHPFHIHCSKNSLSLFTLMLRKEAKDLEAEEK